MNWEAIGAMGEILGALTVIGTLFYLALQIRQNSQALTRANDYAQASSIHESNALYVELYKSLAQDAEMASIYHRALEGEILSSADSVRFGAFLLSYLVWAEDLYYQQRTELGFAQVGDTALLLATIGPYMVRLIRTEPGRTWWDGEGRHHLSPEFHDVVKELLDGDAG
jgi:hypothetical protein